MEEQRVNRFYGGQLIPILAGVILAVLVVGYVALCAWVGNQERILPNVSLLGINVSGMTAQEAQDTLDQAMKEYGDRATVTLTCGDWSGELDCSQFLWETDGMGELALNVGRGSFLAQGMTYLQHTFMGASANLDLSYTTLPTKQPALERLLRSVERSLGDGVQQMTYAVEGEQLMVTKGRPGASFDRERVLVVTDYAAQNALEEAIAQQITTKRTVNRTVDLTKQNAALVVEPDQPDFQALRDALYAEVQEPQMLPNTYEITQHVVGVDLDPQALEAAYGQAKAGETFAFPLTVTQPRDTRETFEAKLFRDLLGKGTSSVGGTAARKTNVKLSAAACDGIILLPGEIFSYNNTTGSRTEDKGYQPAPSYVGGASVDEVGGGICQTSSTIYYAVLSTTLEVVERANHRYAVGYVPDGMDATVWYGSTDFRFQNNTNYPVKIDTESYDSNGKRYLTVKIYGTNEDGRYAVSKRTVYDEIAPTTSYVADETVAQGTLVLDRAQYACTGKKAQVYRYIYAENGTLLETQDMGVSNYKMRPHLYHYNPLDGDPSTWANGVPPTGNQPPVTGDTVEDPTQKPPVTDPTTGDISGGSSELGKPPVEAQPEQSPTKQPTQEEKPPQVDAGLEDDGFEDFDDLADFLV